MSDTFWIALFTGVPAIISAVASLVIAVKGNAKLNSIHRTVDGKFSELLQKVGEAKKVEGAVGVLVEQQRPIIVDRREQPRPDGEKEQ